MLMKKIILLGSKNSGGKNDVRDMHQSLARHSKEADITVVFFEDLLMSVTSEAQSFIDTASGKDMSEADLVVAVNWYKGGPTSLYRDVGFALALYLKSKGVEFWNSEMLKQRSISKVSAMMQLSLLGLPVPTTLFSLSADALFAAVNFTPFIFKSAIASRGADNFLCDSVADAKEQATVNQSNHFMVQEYIPNKSDLRVVCFGGEPKLAIERSRRNDDSHLNNVSQGADAKLKEISELSLQMIEECKKICYNMGREMAGIDVLPEKDKPEHYVYLEVNAIPQLTSGAFVDEKMAALAATLLNSKEE